jgi:hypothetical protein
VFYHRKESPTQSVRIAMLQEKSLEVWGKEPRGSCFPKVQAFKGRLEHVARGIEFDTHVEPDPDGHPHIACWSGQRDGVFLRPDSLGDYVAIKVHHFLNNQPQAEGIKEW